MPDLHAIADGVHLLCIALQLQLVMDRSHTHEFVLPKIQPGQIRIFVGGVNDYKPRDRVQWTECFRKTRRKWHGFKVVTTTVSTQNLAYYSHAIKLGLIERTSGSAPLIQTAVCFQTNKHKFWVVAYAIHGSRPPRTVIVNQTTSHILGRTLESYPEIKQQPLPQHQSMFPAAQEECVGPGWQSNADVVFWNHIDRRNTVLKETWANKDAILLYAPNEERSPVTSPGTVQVLPEGSGGYESQNPQNGTQGPERSTECWIDPVPVVPNIRGDDTCHWLGNEECELGLDQNSACNQIPSQAGPPASHKDQKHGPFDEQSAQTYATPGYYPNWGDACACMVNYQEPLWSSSGLNVETNYNWCRWDGQPSSGRL
ncbi:hypothetical protein MSAN_01155300 [Mycena sanguinolenta]|uniref:Uncharacterized protein n=1 Tax=Mycena sanguinolenta TaxID=230812 RepID=A0A8H6YLG3_9AGAR|nr:hypothetical protein MSAN_01155300 [Mycena sanguinolenta]